MVSLQLDTPELAAQYDVVGQRQFLHGKSLIQDLGIGKGARVLDVGAGTGLLAAHVAKLVGSEGQVRAIDPLPLRVALANQKPDVTAEVGRAEDLGRFAANSFDFVYLNSVIHWIADKAQVLSEVRRVLKPGGKLGFTTAAKERPHDIERLRERALAAVGLSHRAEASVGIPHKVSSAQVRELLHGAGYHVKQVLLRTLIDYQPTVEDVHTFSLASSFGNHLSGLDEGDRQRLRAAFDAELERLRGPEGIRLERHLIFAVAEKPQVS